MGRGEEEHQPFGGAHAMREFLSKLGRKPLVVELTARLGIHSLLGAIYRFLFAPAGGKHEVCVGGRRAHFRVYSATAARALDALGGERPMLEFLMARVAQGDCFYDVGSAVGLYTVFLAQAVGEQGQVVAFEPQRDVYERLRENVKLNRLRNVQAFRLALGEKDSSAILQTAEVAGGGRIVPPGERSPLRSEHVQVAQGDAFIKKQGLPFPRAIKIDVEGHEYSVLSGLSHTLALPCCEFVCCEVHPRLLRPWFDPEAVLGLLRSAGFADIQVHLRGTDFNAWAVKHR